MASGLCVRGRLLQKCQKMVSYVVFNGDRYQHVLLLLSVDSGFASLTRKVKYKRTEQINFYSGENNFLKDKFMFLHYYSLKVFVYRHHVPSFLLEDIMS